MGRCSKYNEIQRRTFVWLEKAKRPYLFFIEEWVESAVVTMGRILYTFRHKTIVSKDKDYNTCWNFTLISGSLY